VIVPKKMLLSCYCLALTGLVYAGAYNGIGVNGWIGSDAQHASPPGIGTPAQDPNSIIINPIFRGWATGYSDYLPSGVVLPQWQDAAKALGTPTGDHADIVSLGDLEAGGINPGEITLVFGDPNIPIGQTDPNGIKNVKGYDFAVFENGFISGFSTSGGSLTGQMLSEFAFVEVSSNGVDFVRFPSVSLTAGPVGAYGTVDVTDVYNLAGKHPNAYGICTGTPFDLAELSDHPDVLAGSVDLDEIRFVRLIDVPGSGEFFDQPQSYFNPDSYDPNETPHWTLFTQNHPVYDAWLTWESGGFDLEAVGVLQEQEYSADINLDGRVDLKDFVIFSQAWQSHFGGEGWVARCDLTESRNLEVDIMDLINFSSQWLSVEQWAILAGSQ
jgi:hypothetical protein